MGEARRHRERLRSSRFLDNFTVADQQSLGLHGRVSGLGVPAPSSPSLAPRSRDGNVGDSGKVTGLGWTTSATKPTIAASKGGDNENVTQSRCNPRR